MKKRWNIVVLLLFVASTIAVAQERGERPDPKRQKEMMEQMKQQRRNYFTQTIGLTEAEAEEFFPLYDEMSEEKFNLYREGHEKVHAIDRGDETPSEEDYIEAATLIEGLAQREATIKQSYFLKFSKILSPQKLYLYERAELFFAKEMLQRDRKKRAERPKNNPQP